MYCRYLYGLCSTVPPPRDRPTTTAHTVPPPNPPTLPTHIYTVRFTHTPYETRSLAAPTRRPWLRTNEPLGAGKRRGV